MLNITIHKILIELRNKKNLTYTQLLDISNNAMDNLDSVELLNSLLDMKNSSELIEFNDGLLTLKDNTDCCSLEDLTSLQFSSVQTSSGGILPKTKLGDTYYKLSNIKSEIYQGFESINEAIVNVLCEKFKFNYLKYSLIHGKIQLPNFKNCLETWLVSSEDFAKGMVKTSLGSVLKYRGISLSDEYAILQTILQFPKEIQLAIWQQSIIDFVICNHDRHVNNIEFLQGKTVCVAPIFDCGCSLGPKFCLEEKDILNFDPYCADITDNCIGSPFLQEMIILFPSSFAVPKIDWCYDDVKQYEQCFKNKDTLIKKSEIISKRLEWLYDLRTQVT